MLYNKNLIIKRLQETENDLLTEKELLTLATPYINNIEQVMASIKNAMDKGHTGEYAIGYVSSITGLSRQTLYRWEKDGIIRKKDNKLNISDLYKSLKVIKSRHVKD